MKSFLFICAYISHRAPSKIAPSSKSCSTFFQNGRGCPRFGKISLDFSMNLAHESTETTSICRYFCQKSSVSLGFKNKLITSSQLGWENCLGEEGAISVGRRCYLFCQRPEEGAICFQRSRGRCYLLKQKEKKKSHCETMFCSEKKKRMLSNRLQLKKNFYWFRISKSHSSTQVFVSCTMFLRWLF